LDFHKLLNRFSLTAHRPPFISDLDYNPFLQKFDMHLSSV